MIYILIGYVYLMIHRPMEIWPGLEPLRLELMYFTAMCAAWCVVWKRLTPDLAQLAIAGMGFVVYASWLMSPWHEFGEIPVKNYTLVIGFALILATTLRNERDVHRVVVAFVCVMALYMLHSLWEFRNGRHTYRMGIVRLVGVDQSLNDPNSFGASMLYALPFVRYLWFAWGPGWRRWALVAYSVMTVGCIGLTGSRGSLLGLGVCVGLIVLLTGRHKLRWLTIAVCLAPFAFLALPDDLKTRFYTIIDPSVGPENARESGQGRILGLLTGLEMWTQFPLLGFGPGAWKPATRMPIESHSLYGQMAGELGTGGIVMFGLLLYSIFSNLRLMARRLRRDSPDPRREPRLHLVQAIGVSTALLLVMGVFGHNLYRYNFVWYAAFGSVLVRSYRRAEVESPAWLFGRARAWA